MDFYMLLGVERGATLNDIKRAYKRLARKHHPDINPGDRMAAAQFRQIAQAYETLSDPARRHHYDAGGAALDSAERTTVGFEGFDFSVSVSGSSASSFGDLFGDLLQSRDERRSAPVAERGADLHQSLSLTFDEAMRGGQRDLVVTRQEHCRSCRGAGYLQTPETRCGHCQGGTVRSVRGHMVFSKSCSHCGGTGVHARTRCPSCGGQQIETRTEPLTINVPAGLPDGARVRVPGKGHAGPGGGEPGDLYITVRVAAHPVFRRDGDDLHIIVPIAIHEAALGAKVDVPSPDGGARLRVPPGTQSGQRFRLRDRGVPSPRTGRRGDLVVEVRLVLPKVIDERSKELLREFGRINAAEDVRNELHHHHGHQAHER